ncbi:PRTRC system protein B [Burkholderia sp. Ac-20353]|uniref:PRTRC system protein B n=1 Tax=Burkholderia sp. Ac-20353 TaxID=2703894 RepID=UPI00197C3851|nr:PRTRC system protein B [Burkholderia sp. Ac-20353]MBN3785669.1 PRTRC system protein B [Burkholderia sp. Ac-20353]
MSGIATGRTGSDVALSHALLLYTGNDGAHFATAHAVIADRKSGRPIIGAGRPLDRKVLVQTLRQLAEHAAPKAEFLPATVLGVSPDAVTWWCPPAMRRVFFECENLGKRSAVVPHPGLVFQASNQGFRVFAVAGSDRPVRETPLFEPPYFNTWDLGRICIGSAHVPKRVDVASIDGWEGGFFDSAFTHPNAGGKRIEYKDGEYAFWRDMLDGKFGETFPLNALVPMKRTVAQLVSGQIGRVE